MICQQIIDSLEKHSPVKYALEWDNVGLQAGRRDIEVKKMMIALDATDDVVRQCVEQGVQMLLTHHPMLYRPQSSVTTDTIIGKRLVELIRNDISYYAMHTNFDVMGMAQLSAQKMGLFDSAILLKTGENEEGRDEGIGRYGLLPKEMTLEEVAKLVKSVYELEFVKVSGNKNKMIKCVAVSGGSGKSLVESALQYKADVLIAGDMDHHTVLDAVDSGLAIIDAGHYGTEKMFVPYMERFLKEQYPDLEIIKAVEHNPFSVI